MFGCGFEDLVATKCSFISKPVSGESSSIEWDEAGTLSKLNMEAALTTWIMKRFQSRRLVKISLQSWKSRSGRKWTYVNSILSNGQRDSVFTIVIGAIFLTDSKNLYFRTRDRQTAKYNFPWKTLLNDYTVLCSKTFFFCLNFFYTMKKNEVNSSQRTPCL